MIIKKKKFREEHGDVRTSYNNFGIVHQALGQYNEVKKRNTTRHFWSGKKYSGRSFVMPQQVMTTWEEVIKLLESTMKRKNAKKRHLSLGKRYSGKSMMILH